MQDSFQGSARPRTAPSTSDVLQLILREKAGGRIALGDLVEAMGERAYGALLLLFAIPNVIPVAIPGWSTVFGLPMILFAGQLATGLHRPWLPRWLADRSISHQDFEKVALKVLPSLIRAERLLKPRLLPLTEWSGERAIGVVCLILAIVITLPIPLGNMLPGLAVTILALGLIERDGVAVLLGHALSLVSLAIVAAVVAAIALAILKAILFFLSSIFG